MLETTTKTDTSTEASKSAVERLGIFFRKQWKESIAEEIWNDLTPFGRITLWIPMWLLTWVGIVIIGPIAIVVFWWCFKVAPKLPKLPEMPPIFFKR